MELPWRPLKVASILVLFITECKVSAKSANLLLKETCKVYRFQNPNWNKYEFQVYQGHGKRNWSQSSTSIFLYLVSLLACAPSCFRASYETQLEKRTLLVTNDVSSLCTHIQPFRQFQHPQLRQKHFPWSLLVFQTVTLFGSTMFQITKS